jgi:nucleotide-binding universal stress UspA family protein
MSAVTQVSDPQQNVRFKRVLIATDFSPPSERALAYSIPIVRHYHSVVSIVHAIQPEPRESITWDPLPRELDRQRLGAEQEMRRLAEEPRIKDLNPHIWLEQGRIWDVVSSIIRRENADLLVLGTHGRGGLKKLALGSAAEEMLRLAMCPVLTVGPNVPLAEPARAEFKTILFATDFGAGSDKAFPYALSLAVACQAKLILLHVVPPLPVVVTGRFDDAPGIYAAQMLTEMPVTAKEESIRRLRKLVPPDANLASPPDCLAGLDFPTEGILGIAEARKADLIVMGANRVASARTVAHIPWTLTHDVICKANCPVLTVLS